MTVLKKATISRWIGLSTDSKPTSVAVGSTFYEYDTKNTYVTYDGTLWSILALGYGLVFAGTCNAAMGASATTIVCADLAGYGNDYFNTQFYMQIVKNANSIGAAPDGEVRKITDYVSSTGTFTTDAFSANVEASDEIYVMHKSIMLILSELPSAGDWALADYDPYDVADADADNERWNTGYLSGAAGGSADINTTTAGKLYMLADYNVAGAEDYYVSHNLPFYADFFKVAENLDITWGSTDGATAKHVAMRISKGMTWDGNNSISIWREKGTGVNRIRVQSNLNGAGNVFTNAAVTDDVLAFKIERLGQTWALFYSTIQFEGTEDDGADWVKVSEVEDPSNYMTNEVTYYHTVFNGTAGDANETAQGDWDNFVYKLGTGGGSQYIAGDYSSAWVSPDIDGNVFERQEAIQKAINITDAGTLIGFEEDGTGANIFETLIAVQSVTTGAGTTTTIADTARTEGADYWNNHLAILLGGSADNQIRVIVDDDGAGVLTVRPAFAAAPGNAVAYAILKKFEFPVSATDGTENYNPRDVVGSKADTADYTFDTTTSSLVRLVKGLLGAKVIEEGTFTTSSATVPADTGLGGSYGNDYFKGQILLPLTGSVAFQPRRIVGFTTTTGVFTVDPNNPFTAATGTVTYVILSGQTEFVPAADATINRTPSDVIGNKADTIPLMSAAPSATDSMVRHLKAILERVGATPADPDDSVLTNLGQRDDAATNDDMSDITTTSVEAKLRLILNRLSADAFTATIQGSARTALDTMLAQIATYLSAAGAAMSIQVNNQTARTNLEQALEDFFTVMGIDGANVFDPAMFAGSQTTVEAAFAALGTALGAEFDGTPDVYDVLYTGVDSSGILADSDGSIIERLEEVDLKLSRQDFGELADWDNFDVADADANTERWDVGYVSGTEGGTADISTTTVGKLRISVDPDITPTAANYGVHLAQAIVSKYFTAIVDLDVASFGTPAASWATLGMRVSPTTYDTNNVVYCQRQSSSGGVGNRIAVGAIFGGANQGEVYFTTADTALAFRIDRLDNVWRCYYSLTQYPDFAWVLLSQYEDAAEGMDSQQSVYLDAYSPGNADTQTAVGDWDNFRLYESLKGVMQAVAGDYDSSAVAADEDGSLAERMEQIQEAVNRGTGSSVPANKSLVDLLGAAYVDAGGGFNLENVRDDLRTLARYLIDGTAGAEAGTVLPAGKSLYDAVVVDRLAGADSTGAHSHANDATEQTVATITTSTRIKVHAIWFDMVNLTQNATIRVKYKIDASTYRTFQTERWLTTDDDGVLVEGSYAITNDLTVTLESDIAEGAIRSVPYSIIYEVME